jgi:hypothetical protein
MTERKPHNVDFESWVERKIREAAERGEFDDLPGAGKPLDWLRKPDEEQGWIRQKMRSENLAPVLPPSLALRKEAHEALTAASRAGSEAEVRRLIESINDKIRAAIRLPPSGPPLNLVPFDVDRVLRQWRNGQAAG